MTKLFSPRDDDQERILSSLLHLTVEQRISWAHIEDHGDAYYVAIGGHEYTLRSEDGDGVAPFRLLIEDANGHGPNFMIKSHLRDGTVENETASRLLTELYEEVSGGQYDNAMSDLLEELDSAKEPPSL